MPTKKRAVPAKKQSVAKQPEERPALIEVAVPVVPELTQPIDPQPSEPAKTTERTEEAAHEVPAQPVSADAAQVTSCLPPDFHQFAETLFKKTVEDSIKNVQTFLDQYVREMTKRATDEARKASANHPQPPSDGLPKQAHMDACKLTAGRNVSVDGSGVRAV